MQLSLRVVQLRRNPTGSNQVRDPFVGFQKLQSCGFVTRQQIDLRTRHMADRQKPYTSSSNIAGVALGVRRGPHTGPKTTRRTIAGHSPQRPKTIFDNK